MEVEAWPVPACAAARPSSRPTARGTDTFSEKLKQGAVQASAVQALLLGAVSGRGPTSGGVVLLAQISVYVGVAEALQVPCKYQQRAWLRQCNLVTPVAGSGWSTSQAAGCMVFASHKHAQMKQRRRAANL